MSGSARLLHVYRILLMLTVCGITSFQVQGQRTSAPGSDRVPEPIRLGMSTALSGPAESLGYHMKLGVEAAIHEANQSGGIQGRLLELIALDDGYEPERTPANMYRLIDEDGVVAIVGNVGTPTAVAAIPIANTLKTPFYGAYTGAGVLRKSPPDRYVINYRASYAQETAAMVDALIETAGLQPEEIGFFTQRDAYGDAGFTGGIAALKRHGLTDLSQIAHGRYPRNTLAVENGVADIMQAPTPCKAVIMVGSYAPCASFIRIAEQVGLDAMYLNVSFVGAKHLASNLGQLGNGVIVTQVVPSPMQTGEIGDAYRTALHTFDPDAEPTYGSFEGYLSMRLFIRALGSIEGPVDRESVVDALESIGEVSLDPEIQISLSQTDHQASDRVWASVLQDGDVVPFDWSDLSERLTAVTEGVAHEE